MILGPQAIGTDASYPITLTAIGTDGNPAPANITGASAILASIWPGGNQAVSATEAVAVVSAMDGSCVLTVSAADTQAVGVAGICTVRVLYTTAAGHTLEGWRGQLQLADSPGTGAAPKVYCTRRDMTAVAGWIDRVQDLDADLGGFASQRGQARQTIDETVMARYRSILDDQVRRHGPLSSTPPIVPTSGVDAGPYWGPSAIPDVDMQAQIEGLAATLAADTPTVPTLRLDARLTRIAALLAVAIVCDQQLGEAAEGTSYQALARKYRQRALTQLYGCEFKVNTTVPPGFVADLVIR